MKHLIPTYHPLHDRICPERDEILQALYAGLHDLDTLVKGEQAMPTKALLRKAIIAYERKSTEARHIRDQA